MCYFYAILFVLRVSKTGDNSDDCVCWQRMQEVCHVKDLEEYSVSVFRIEKLKL